MKKKFVINRFTLPVVLCWLLCTTCTKEHLFDCFVSTGSTVTHYRSAAAFTRIVLENTIDLKITPDTTPYIKVTAGEHLIDGIITELQGNTLYLRNENKCNWVRSFNNQYVVEVGVEKIEKIDYYGSGDINFLDTNRAEDFTFESWNGSGSITMLLNIGTGHINNNAGRPDLHVFGKCAVSYVYINDTGNIDASGMETGYTYLRNNSTGDCRINVIKELGVTIDYIGNVYYRGHPYLVDQIINGAGRLIKED